MMMLEVMDKELTVRGMWSTCLVVGALGFLAGRWRRWAAVPFAAYLMFVAYGVIAELRDPYVGPDIIAETGCCYRQRLLASVSVGVILIEGGLWRRRSATSAQ